MHNSVNDSIAQKPISPLCQARSLELWERLVLEERVHSSFSLVSPLSNVLSWFLRLSLSGGEWWVIFIFCLSRSRVDSSEDVNHWHWVKGGKWPCLSEVISSSLLLPYKLKNIGIKRSILNILKVAHDKFTWNVKKYHA